jgi:hypothetical protein
MSAFDEPAAVELDLSRPNVARTYDYYLGGDHNWAIDRAHGDSVIENLWPDVSGAARQNRDFLRRAVTAASQAGLDQFLDLGSGIPTVGNVHDLVRTMPDQGAPGRVVYVDYEPVAAAHARVILEREQALDRAGIIHADLRSVDHVLEHDTTRQLLDFSRPICLLLVAVLHFFDDESTTPALLRAYTAKLPPGSWLVFSHFTPAEDGTPQDQQTVEAVREAYTKTTDPFWPRNHEQISALLDSLPEWELLEPGLVHAPDWRPDHKRTREDERLWPFFLCAALEKVR